MVSFGFWFGAFKESSRNTFPEIKNVSLSSWDNKNEIDTAHKSVRKNKLNIEDLAIDKQLMDRIFKFASIKHILNNFKNDQAKVIDLLQEIERDLKNYELEMRIEELESKFAQDFSENTFNQIKELKKKQNIN